MMLLTELSEGRLALKESLCRGTLRTAAALGAGDTHLRGRLLYHLHAALAERARRCPALYEVSIHLSHIYNSFCRRLTYLYRSGTRGQ